MPGLTRHQPPGQTSGQQDSDDAGDEDAVEGAGAADGGVGCGKFADVIEAQKVGPDEDAERARDIGERRALCAINNEGNHGCGEGCNKDRHADAEPGHRPAEAVADHGHQRNGDEHVENIQAAVRKEIKRKQDRNDGAPDVDGDDGAALERPRRLPQQAEGDRHLGDNDHISTDGKERDVDHAAQKGSEQQHKGLVGGEPEFAECQGHDAELDNAQEEGQQKEKQQKIEEGEGHGGFCHLAVVMS